MTPETAEPDVLAPACPAVLDLVGSVQQCDLNSDLGSQFIDSPGLVADVLDVLTKFPVDPPSLYVDLEGVSLSRHGTISILQLHVLPKEFTYLIDVYALREKAFHTAGSNGLTLKMILESSDIPKVFFDVRNDSDALYSHYGIELDGIRDLQLMELATRTISKRLVNGLSRCIERDAGLSSSEKEKWKSVKAKGLKLFAPERGGNYEVFNARPLAEDVRLYCLQDVQFMPRLWSIYSSKLSADWAINVDKATKDRVTSSQREDFNGKGSHMALGPWPAKQTRQRRNDHSLWR